MKIVYILNRNSSQFSYLYNIYKVWNGPIYCPSYDSLFEKRPNNIPNTPILKTFDQLKAYNPNFILYTDFDLLWGKHLTEGNWCNIYIGHGHSNKIFDEVCEDKSIDDYNSNYLNLSNYTKNGPYHLYDYIFVPSEMFKNSFEVLLKIKPKKIKIIGYPRLDNISRYTFLNSSKPTLLYAPSWTRKPSLLYMKNIIFNLSNYYTIFVIFHSNTLLNDEISAIAKLIASKRSDNLKVIYREEYKSIFDNIDKNVLKINDDGNILQKMIYSTDFTLCDTESGVFWDCLFLQKPFFKINSDSTFSIEELKEKIDKKELTIKIKNCDKEYSIREILGESDNKSSEKCIQTLKSLL